MSRILALLLILGLLLPFAIPGKPRGGRKGRQGESNSGAAPRNPYHPSGPREASEPRETRGIKRALFEAYEHLRDWSRPAKRARAQPSALDLVEPPPFQPLPPNIEALETKWRAVVEFRHLRDIGQSTNEAVDEIGERLGVGSGRNVRLLSDYVEERGSLVRKVGSGTPRIVSNRPDILEFFEEQAKDFEYIFTYEVMAQALKEEFGVGSTATVKKIMDHLEYAKKSRIIRPFLTEEHKAERLNWAKKWSKVDFFDEKVVVVHIDEKCFYAFSNRGKVAYMPPGMDPKPLYALSKTQIPWVMFLGAVAAPRDDVGFDGKIGLWHVGEEKVAQRKSKFHERGDVYYINANMDGDLFLEMVKDKLIPAIIKKCQWAKKVIVQLDSAGGHRVGETLEAFNKIGKKSKPPIEFITQPTRSPDTNVLDLGIWNSMKSRVAEVRYDRKATESMNQRIINAVSDMWEDYDPAKLNNIFITLTAVLEEIEKDKGGNSFKQPHTVKDHL
jgi:transposase